MLPIGARASPVAGPNFSRKFVSRTRASGGSDGLDSLIDNLGDSDLSALVVPDVAMDLLNHRYSKPNPKSAAKAAPAPADDADSMDVDIGAQTAELTGGAASSSAAPAPASAPAVPELVVVPGMGAMSKEELAAFFADDFSTKPKTNTGGRKPAPAKKSSTNDDEEGEDDGMDVDEDNHKYTGDDWWKIASNVDAAAIAAAEAVPVASGSAYRCVPPPIQKDGSGSAVYWFDMHEDAYNMPGVLHIFGKVFDETSRRYLSVCVFVQSVDRVLHFAPKAGADMNALKQEVIALCESQKIKNIRSKVVTKKYAFEVPGVQHGESQFLEVRYPYAEPALPADYTAEHFVHVFGARRSAMETFTLERHFMGPGWILVKNIRPHDLARTWCRFECSVDKATDIEVLDSENRPNLTPAITVMSLKIQTMMDPQSRVNEIIAVTLLTKYHGTASIFVLSWIFRCTYLNFVAFQLILMAPPHPLRPRISCTKLLFASMTVSLCLRISNLPFRRTHASRSSWREASALS